MIKYILQKIQDKTDATHIAEELYSGKHDGLFSKIQKKPHLLTVKCDIPTIKNATIFQVALRTLNSQMIYHLGAILKDEIGEDEYNRQLREEEGNIKVLLESPAFDFNDIATAITRSSCQDILNELDHPAQPHNTELSQALAQFRIAFDTSSSKGAYFNLKHLLEAVKIYNKNSNKWNELQRILFCVQVIGYVQRSLPTNYTRYFVNKAFYCMFSNQKRYEVIETGRDFNQPDDDLGFSHWAIGVLYGPQLSRNINCKASYPTLPGTRAVALPPRMEPRENIYIQHIKSEVKHALTALERCIENLKPIDEKRHPEPIKHRKVLKSGIKWLANRFKVICSNAMDALKESFKILIKLISRFLSEPVATTIFKLFVSKERSSFSKAQEKNATRDYSSNTANALISHDNDPKTTSSSKHSDEQGEKLAIVAFSRFFFLQAASSANQSQQPQTDLEIRSYSQNYPSLQ